jgi:DnaJ-class molecular chaperone
MIVGQVVDACHECGEERLSIGCLSCRGKGAKGVFSKRDCNVCGGTGTVIVCSNMRCGRFEKRITGSRAFVKLRSRT